MAITLIAAMTAARVRFCSTVNSATWHRTTCTCGARRDTRLATERYGWDQRDQKGSWYHPDLQEASKASALNQTSIATSRKIAAIRTRDDAGNDIAHDVMFAFAFTPFGLKGLDVGKNS